jgi:hypothetical protein
VAWLQVERPKLLGLSGIKIKKEKKLVDCQRCFGLYGLGWAKIQEKGFMNLI